MLSYPAKISFSRKDRFYLVSFPDFPNVNTYGDSITDAINKGTQALALSFEVDFERGFKMPAPSKIKGRNIHQVPSPLHIYKWWVAREFR
jgi:antitoxin HicB